MLDSRSDFHSDERLQCIAAVARVSLACLGPGVRGAGLIALPVFPHCYSNASQTLF